MSEEQKRQLNQQLWNIANTLRGKMDADEFRDYILGFIFYKYLSEKMELYANCILIVDKINYIDINENTNQGRQYLEAIKEESLEKLGYFLKPSELFKEVAKRGNGNGKNESNFIIEDIQKILINIQNSTMGTDSEEDFDHLFEDLDLNSTKLGKTAEQRNEVIAKVLAHLDKIDFQLEHSELDVLGDAYEYLIGQFASGAGKKAGEFYTPQQASKILARIVTLGKTRIKSAYDPAAGSGSLILRLGKECDVLKFYGQERNRTTYNLCRMNMILHGIHFTRFDIKLEDTLEHPQHNKLEAEAVVANPPFSAQWSASPLFMTDDRFSEYGKLAPSTKADFAFIQHMIYHLAENGVMAVVMPHGVLFRGAAEGHIRKYLIEEKNYLDAVIGLPINIFYGTGIPTCIMVFKKCREHPDDILFIDASQYFEKVKTQNFLREEDVDRIVDTYAKRITIDKYSYVASIEKVRENDYNLNIPRYVDTFEEEDLVEINSVCELLEMNRKKSDENELLLKNLCKEINLPYPNGNNISLLQKYKRGVMQKIFSQEVRFKDDNGNEFPKWEKKLLRKITNIYDGTHQTPDYVLIGIPFYSVEQVTADDFKNTKFISEDIFEKENKRVKLEMGDILMTRIGDIGTAKYIDWDVNASFYVSLALIKQSRIFNSKYLCQYISSQNFQRELWKRTIHVAFPKKINLGEIGECEVELPIPPEQSKIANFLTAIDKKIEHTQKGFEITK